MVEFVPRSGKGREFTAKYIVRLGDADTNGVLRLDGVARLLQDIATDDWDDTGIVSNEIWVVRRTSVRVADGGEWPSYKDRLSMTTWCGGTGAAWAERRTNISRDGRLLIEAVAIWVPVDSAGHPLRISPLFFEVYGDAVRGRKVSGRVATPRVSPVAVTQPWPLRRADLDVIGHVNNAALWQAVTEVAEKSVRYVEVIHHGSVAWGQHVTLASTADEMWLLVDGAVQVFAAFSA